ALLVVCGRLGVVAVPSMGTIFGENRKCYQSSYNLLAIKNYKKRLAICQIFNKIKRKWAFSSQN
ncbi:MAG: hypothetical protein LBR39_03605, partial [Coriobacteriales bacterium]|nr:hypothetical protein [Coriobacteriales bacterium]